MPADVSLTPMERAILDAMRDNEYTDCLEPHASVWTFSAIYNSGIPAAQARGVISSLIKKGLISAGEYDGEPILSYTDAGRALYPTPETRLSKPDIIDEPPPPPVLHPDREHFPTE